MNKKLNIEQQVKELISKEIDSLEYKIVCVQQEKKVIQIMVERKDEAKIQIADCVKINSLIRPILESILEEYSIELGSPGIDRPLVSIEDFVKYKGFLAGVELKENVDNKKRIKAIIGNVKDNGEISFLLSKDKKPKANSKQKADEEKSILIQYDNILKAKLVLTDELIKRVD